MSWRIYYGPDNHTDGSGPGPTGDRARGIQVILQHHPDVGWYTQNSSDYYIWHEQEKRWVGVDIFGLFDFLLESGLVLFGRTITNREFQAVMDRVVEDRAWGRKHGYLGRDQERVLDG